MSALTIPTDATLEHALLEQATSQGKTMSELAREILSRALFANRRPASRHRQKEHEWRRTHREELQAFAGQWVVLDGEQIIAHGEDPARLVETAREKGIGTPYIFRVEPPSPNTVKIGL